MKTQLCWLIGWAQRMQRKNVRAFTMAMPEQMLWLSIIATLQTLHAKQVGRSQWNMTSSSAS